MIRADFLAETGGLLAGFSVLGHAGLAEAGEDVLCAAVSSAVYLTVNTVTDVLHIAPLALRADKGELFFRIEPKDEELCRPLFEGLKLHLQGLEEQYPGHLRVCYLEV